MAKKHSAGRKSGGGNAPAARPEGEQRRKRRPAPPAVSRTDYSLEDILSEFRSAAPSREAPEAAMESDETDLPNGEGAAVPAEETARETGEAVPAQRGEETGEAVPTQRGEETGHEPVPPRVEGYEDDPAAYAEPVPFDEDAPPSAGQAPEGKEQRPGPGRGGLLYRLHGRLLGLLAVAGMKRQERQREENAAPPEEEREMEPLAAARFYARQMPALRRRCQMAAAVTVLPVWIALAAAVDVPIPGSLASDIRVASLVSLIAMLTVMIIGLDVITSGIMSLVRCTPGAESLIALGCLASAIDCVLAAVMGEEGTPLPPCAVCCVSVCLALLGSRYHCLTYRATFLTLSRNPGAFAVTSEHLMGRKEAFLIKSRQSFSGFVRRSEEADGCESMMGLAAPFVAIASLIFSVLALIGNRDPVRLPHTLALLLSVTAAWPGLFALPGFMADAALRFHRNGSAVAGWNGIREIGASRHLIITDSDIFPEGSVSLSGVNILEGAFTEQVLSCTGSMMCAAGTELAGVFADLMERGGGSMETVEEFTVGEGGVSGRVGGVRVFVGCAGYMYLQGVKIPAKLREGDTIYTAFEKKLVGAFRMNYTAEPSIAAALQTLQRNKRRPIFAVRDFNVDQKMIREKFRCGTDDFEFPDMPDRYAASQVVSSGDRSVSALLSGGGLGRLVELSSRSRWVYWLGVICQGLTLGCILTGLGFVFLNCWLGAWSAVSCFRILLFMLCWTAPCLLMGLFEGK